MSPSPCPCSPSPAGAEPWLLCPAPALAAAPRPGAWQSLSCAAASGPAAAPLLDGTGAAAGPAPAQAPSHPWGLFFFFFGTIFGALNQDKEQSNGLKIDQSVNCCLKYFIIYCLQPALSASAHYASGTSLSLRCAWSRALLQHRVPHKILFRPVTAQPKGRACPRVPSPKAPSSPGLIQLRDLLELAFNLQTFTISFELI